MYNSCFVWNRVVIYQIIQLKRRHKGIQPAFRLKSNVLLPEKRSTYFIQRVSFFHQFLQKNQQNIGFGGGHCPRCISCKLNFKGVWEREESVFLLSTTVESLVLLQCIFHLHGISITTVIIIRVYTFKIHLYHDLDSSQVLNGLIHFTPVKECVEVTIKFRPK